MICNKVRLTSVLKHLTKLKYPRAELIVLRKTAERIMSRANREGNRSPPERKKTLIIVPNTSLSKPVQAMLSSSVTIVSTGGRKLGDILKQKKMLRKMKTAWLIRCHVVDVPVLIAEKPDGGYARVCASI